MKCYICDKVFKPGDIIYRSKDQPFCVICGNGILEKISEAITQAENELSNLRNKFKRMVDSQEVGK